MKKILIILTIALCFSACTQRKNTVVTTNSNDSKHLVKSDSKKPLTDKQRKKRAACKSKSSIGSNLKNKNCD